MYNLEKVMAIVGLFLVNLSVYAQNALPTMGGDIVSPAGSLSYTVGQIDVGSAIGLGQASLYEGVQQTYTVEELRVRTPEKDIKILVYPNPTVDGVFVEIPSFETGVLYELLTTHGSMLKSGTINNAKQRIDMSAYPASTYVLRIVGKGYECDFKIMKIK